MPVENFLQIGEIKQVELPQGKEVFEVEAFAKCGELTFVNMLQDKSEGRVCIPCAE